VYGPPSLEENRQGYKIAQASATETGQCCRTPRDKEHSTVSRPGPIEAAPVDDEAAVRGEPRTLRRLERAEAR